MLNEEVFLKSIFKPNFSIYIASSIYCLWVFKAPQFHQH